MYGGNVGADWKSGVWNKWCATTRVTIISSREDEQACRDNGGTIEESKTKAQVKADEATEATASGSESAKWVWCATPEDWGEREASSCRAAVGESYRTSDEALEAHKLLFKTASSSSSTGETIKYSSGFKYVGGVSNGLRHGQGTLTLANGAKYVGNWKNGDRHGQGKQPIFMDLIM